MSPRVKRIALGGQQFALRDRAAYLCGGYPSGTQHMETQDTVRALLARLPDDCTLADVPNHLCILQEVGRGRADVQGGPAATTRAGRG
jgi:hypothetical protein